MSFKVALLGIYHESNTFINVRTTLQDFKNARYLKGEAIREEYRNAYHEIGGMIEIMETEGVELAPVMYAEATPGGIIAAETFEELTAELMKELDKVLPVDGILVAPHGAGVSERYLDMDGRWLSLLRAKLGDKIPIVGALDPHANVSSLMIASTNALIAYKTNPHIDQRDTGKAAAVMLMGMLKGEIHPVQKLIEIPLAISIERQCTDDDPCKRLYQYADILARQEKILSISILLGFPYADVAEMGTSAIVIADNDYGLAAEVGERLTSYLLSERKTFNGEKMGIEESLAIAQTSPKPVLLLDMGDNVGGGSPGDSVILLKALESTNSLKSFACIYDPKSVLQLSALRPGELKTIHLGGGGEAAHAYTVTVKVLGKSDGRFKETSPRHGGQVNYDMGQTALVSTLKGNVVMITSLRVAPFSLQQLISSGVIPEEFDVLAAKGVNAPIAAYGPVCATIIQVNTPGVTQADMTGLHYHRRRKPLFPFEEPNGELSFV